jgi:hypothetical protein
VQVQLTVTLALFQPAPFAAGRRLLKVITGATVSIRTVVFAEVVWFPTASWALQFKTVEPCPVTVIVPLADPVPIPVTPDKATVPPDTRVQVREATDMLSVAVTVPVAGLAVNQPLGLGVKVTVTVGLVLSDIVMFRV